MKSKTYMLLHRIRHRSIALGKKLRWECKLVPDLGKITTCGWNRLVSDFYSGKNLPIIINKISEPLVG